MVNHMRRNRSQRASRRSHHALVNPALAKCKDCGEMHRNHTMCQNCGKYAGKTVVDVHSIIAKKEKKAKEKAKAQGK